MEQIAKLLRQAYNTIREADTSDIDAFYLAVEEAQGFIAEALDKADNPEVNPNSVTISNIDAMSDELYDALDTAFKQELVAKGVDPDTIGWDYWTIKADYTPDCYEK